MPDHRHWPQNDVDRLLRLWPSHSASQIGAKLGRSRSAICGKIGRLYRKGLLITPRSKHYAVIPPRTPRTPSRPKPRVPMMEEKANSPSVSSSDQAPARLMMRPCLLSELNRHRCRWPLGPIDETAMLFCGGDTIDRYPYCAHHVRIATGRGGGNDHIQ